MRRLGVTLFLPITHLIFSPKKAKHGQQGPNRSPASDCGIFSVGDQTEISKNITEINEEEYTPVFMRKSSLRLTPLEERYKLDDQNCVSDHNSEKHTNIQNEADQLKDDRII